MLNTLCHLTEQLDEGHFISELVLFAGSVMISKAHLPHINPSLISLILQDMAKKKSETLIVILGDQLSPDMTSLDGVDPATSIVLMVEVMAEATYVGHHKKKLAFIFSSMRHFADELRTLGWQVDYIMLDDAKNTGTFTSEVERAIARHQPKSIRITEAGEWRVKQMIETWQAQFGMSVNILTDERFIASIAEFSEWASERKQLRMEYFYRDMRRKTHLLMNGDDPEGGQWNYDHDNRKPASDNMFKRAVPQFKPDAITTAVLNMVAKRFKDNFGDLEPFWFATCRTDAEKAFKHFLKHALPSFGDYQDAMLRNDKFLYHALCGQYLNIGWLDPLAMCRLAEVEYRKGHAPLNAVEGFIRQILGWREYIRGIYWQQGPDYVHSNALNATRPLPDFYWSGETKMACVAACITQTREEAYAHHIQRLMVTGTFALLAGINPHAVHEWYLSVYADAYEWVELPNVVGMSQYADGGILASKPYAASGAYIDRMSDYCGSCAYKVKLKAGPDACPFNYLYWDFIARHKLRWSKNPRMGQMVHTYEKMSAERKAEIKSDATVFLNSLA